MDIFFIYLVSGLVAVIIAYAAIRAIDYAFAKREDDRRYGYRLGTINYACKHGRKMAMSMVKEINQSIYDMVGKWDER